MRFARAKSQTSMLDQRSPSDTSGPAFPVRPRVERGPSIFDAMNRRTGVRTLLSLGFLLVVAIVHYTNLTGSGDVRPILMVSLIGIGMLVGIMLQQVFGLFRSGNPGSPEDGTS